MKEISFRAPKPNNRKKRILACMLILFITLATFTQYTAYKLKYHPALGKPIYKHAYNPVSGIKWYLKYNKKYPQIFQESLEAGSAVLILLTLLFALILIWGQRTQKFIKDLHGSARWAEIKDIKQMGLIQDEENDKGVILGGFQEKEFLHYLQSNGQEPCAVIAPPRSGKGVSVVIPTVLTWGESAIIFDYKKEIFLQTAGARQAMGQKILKFSPAEEDCTCEFNPLAEIRIDSIQAISDAQNIATVVVDPEGKGFETKDGHWKKKARSMIAAAMIHMLYIDPDVTMGEIGYKFKLDIEGFLEEMRDNDHDDTHIRQFVAAGGASLLNTPDRERGSIISTAEAFFDVYQDPIVDANTSKSTFRIQDLMDADQPITLYIVVKPKDLVRLTPVLRILMTQIILVLTDDMKFEGNVQIRRKHKLLLLWDEFPLIGKLELFEKQLAFMPGFGIKVMLVIQDIAQLWRIYTKDESILSTCIIIVAFAPTKPETAEWLSKLIGTTTVLKKAVTRSGKVRSPHLDQVSISTQEVSRPLMTADEVMQLQAAKKDKNDLIIQPGKVLIRFAGYPVILGTQTLFFIDPEMQTKTKMSPPMGV